LSLPGPVPVPVVFDVNVLVLAVAVDESPFRSWPSPPPVSGNPSADCLGVINDAAEFALWLSPHIMVNTGRVLVTALKTPEDEVDEYLQVLAEMADASGGRIVDPPQTVGDCADWQDNRILDLAAEVGAFIVVSADADLSSMSPWRGRPIVGSAQFASLMDASRRARRANGECHRGPVAAELGRTMPSWLITQRSRVQIPPPLPSKCRSEA
jgi:predicted nucleic acid-binding protein